MDWAEITITTTSEGIDTVTNILDMTGISGVSIYDRKDFEELQKQGEVWDYIDDSLKYESGPSRVCAYIPFNDEVEHMITALSNQLEAAKKDSTEDMGDCHIRLSRLNDEDWANSWKKYYKPVHVGQKIIIKPTWESVMDSENKIIIEMDPGAAFGTGTHETTQLCLEMLEKHLIPGDITLDIGTGTGILSVAAEKLGAAFVTAVDRDELALDAAKENLRRNECAQWEVFKSDLLKSINKRYSLVIANIVADPILMMLADLHRVMLDDAKIILSGIILDRAQDVRSAYTGAGYQLIDKGSKGEWTAMVFQKGKNDNG